MIDTVNEPLVMGGECQRVSVFLSVFDVHVQYAPVPGKITFFKYSLGQFLNALGPIVVYEHDDSDAIGRYRPEVRLPPAGSRSH